VLEASELFDQFPLTIRYSLWQLNVDFGVQVAFLVTLTEVGHALAAQSEYAPVLGSRRNPELELTSIRRGDLDVAAEHHDRQGSRYPSAEVDPLTLEAWIGFNLHYQIEVAGPAPIGSAVALAGKSNT
jgi:hypothetical protein